MLQRNLGPAAVVVIVAACGGSKSNTSQAAGAGAATSSTTSASSSGRSSTSSTGTSAGSGSGAGGGDGGAGGSGPACGTGEWTTWNHDAQRTGASDGCVNGPLTTSWRYVPTAPTGRTFKDVWSIAAQTDGVFLQWSASDDPYLGTTAADRVDLTGKQV
jgi:hypothetical protein